MIAKEEIIKLALPYQDNFNQDLKSIENYLSELRENFFKLETVLLSPSRSTMFCVTKWLKLNKNLDVMRNTPDVNV